jgi:hypothetical protein
LRAEAAERLNLWPDPEQRRQGIEKRVFFRYHVQNDPRGVVIALAG